jgi:hypothetical protein
MDRLICRRGRRHLGFLLGFIAIGGSGAGAQTVVGGVVGAPFPPSVQGQPPRDRPPAPPRVGTAAIKGQVVDGVTGNPIPRARVRLLNNPAQKPAVLTDADGAFAFTGLPAGPYSVMAEKSTFLAGRYPEVSRSIRAASQPFLVRDGQAVQIAIPMFRGGVITGRVVDAHGDPVDVAQVRVLRVQRGGRPVTAGQAQTNDLGEYRVPRLQPGRYVVQVRPSMQPQGGLQDPNVNEVPLPQPVPTYYPSVQALSEAQAVTVGRGETVPGMDMMLAEGVPTLITGTVLRSDGEPIAAGSISTRFTGPDSAFGFDSGGGTGIRPGGSFRLMLPPGEYTFDAQVPTRIGTGVGPTEQLFGTVRVTVGASPIEEVAIMVGRGATATGKIVFEGTSSLPTPNPSPTRIPLYNPSGPGCRPAELTVAADWTFKIEGLNGTCGAQPGSVFGQWTLKAFTVRGRNLIDETMTFENGQAYSEVQVVVTDRRTLMDLRVSGDDGQPTRDYVAIAFPVAKEKWTSPMLRPVRTYVPPPTSMMMFGGQQRAESSPSGATAPPQMMGGRAAPPERFVGLTPGDYYVLAIDDIQFEDSQDPGVLEKLATSAVRVTLTDEAPLEVPLRRFSFAELMR